MNNLKSQQLDELISQGHIHGYTVEGRFDSDFTGESYEIIVRSKIGNIYFNGIDKESLIPEIIKSIEKFESENYQVNFGAI